MAQVQTISSNVTELRYAEEASFKTLGGSPVWYGLQPNSYQDFGGEITTVSRRPITADRQLLKGTVTDLDASGGFNVDLTHKNLQDLLQGFLFADLRRKGEELVTAVDTDTTNPDEFEVASTAGFLAGSLVQGQNFTNPTNNGVFEVTGVVTDVSVDVADGSLVLEASPPADAQIVVVGHVGVVADLDVSVLGALPAITSSSLDFTTLGLTAGEWIYVGGDAAGTSFVNAENNGFKRIRSISANTLTFDKSVLPMTGETGSGLTIHLYFGRVLRNEAASGIKRRTYQIERTLGAPDDALPAEIQAEYLEGQVPSQFTLTIPTADKVTCDCAFVGADHTQIDGPTALKTGSRPTIALGNAFNTSLDFSRIKMSTVVPGEEAPTALFSFVTEMNIVINNNVTANKGVGELGAIEVTAGVFEVTGDITAYFANVAAIQAVRNNADVTIDMALVKSNQGIVIDIPLMALGNSRLTVEQDSPITLPLSMSAAKGSNVDSALDYTLMMNFFDYLPSAANS